MRAGSSVKAYCEVGLAGGRRIHRSGCWQVDGHHEIGGRIVVQRAVTYRNDRIQRLSAPSVPAI